MKSQSGQSAPLLTAVQHNIPIPAENRSKRILFQVYMDLGGPYTNPSGTGPKKSEIYWLLTDDYTRYRWIRFVKPKSKEPTILKE
jgi:hypothetical protein